MQTIPLTKLQREIMQEFYNVPATKVIYNKNERNVLWKLATTRSEDLDFIDLQKKCPALVHQIKKKLSNRKKYSICSF